MAERVTLTDDLDGSEPAHRVCFGLDGVNYEIDLSEENIARLWAIYEPIKKAGRQR